MGARASLNRVQAAAWCTKTTGYRVSHATLHYWEISGLLRAKGQGRRVPTSYNLEDLVRLRVLAELRRGGAPLQRVRRALRNLAKLLPEIVERPGAWQLAVTATGDVVRIQSDRKLIQLTRRSGQTGWIAMFDLGAFVREARAAIEKAA